MSHTPWFFERDMEATGLRLFCLPHAGSGSAGYRSWKRDLPESIAVCPVMLPGRESRLAEKPLDRVQDVIAPLHTVTERWLDRPYAIFGHSMGSILAYEWAQALQATTLRQPECLIVSGRSAPHLGPGHRKLRLLDDLLLLEALQEKYGSSQAALLENAELRELFLPILRADLTLVETYEHPHTQPLTCPVYAFAGDDDTSVPEAGLEAWRDLTTGFFESCRFPGDHFYLQTAGRKPLLQAIATLLAS